MRLPLSVVAVLAAAVPAFAEPFDACGTLVQGVPCVLLRIDSGPRYIVPPLQAPFMVGDRVRIVGTLDPGCFSICLQGDGCVSGTMTYCPPPCPADWDHNGAIEPADVAAFVATWFTSLQNGTLAGDFDGDGTVTPADVGAFVGRWFAALNGNC